MKKKNSKTKVISNFNISIFENLLIKNNFDIDKSNFENLYAQINKLKNNNYQKIIFFIDLENLIPKFNFITSQTSVKIKREILFLCSLILENINNNNKVFCICFKPRDNVNDYEYVNQTNLGLKKFLYEEANYFFKKKLANNENISFIETTNYSGKIIDEKKWFYLKSLYTEDYLKYILNKIKNYSIEDKRFKLIVLDLDNTLWGGNVGDLGWDKVRLGGIDPLGEAYKKFQFKIKEYKEKGVVLSICSKNFENNALDVFNKNNEMVLKKNDFVDIKINWETKSKNINETLTKLNLRSSDALFIDDNIAELDEVKKNLPDINTLLLNYKMLDFPYSLDNIKRLNFLPNTKEDSLKTKLYNDEIKRINLKKNNTNDLSWKKSLRMSLSLSEINKTNITRVEQLFLKTNQINLSNNRKKQKDIYEDIDNEKNYNVFELKDKFGSSGIISVISFYLDKEFFILEDFIMSCRVYGRDIEYAILNLIIEKFKKNKNVKFFRINFKKTNYNTLMKNILNNYFNTNKINKIDKKNIKTRFNVNKYINIMINK